MYPLRNLCEGVRRFRRFAFDGVCIGYSWIRRVGYGVVVYILGWWTVSVALRFTEDRKKVDGKVRKLDKSISEDTIRFMN